MPTCKYNSQPAPKSPKKKAQKPQKIVSQLAKDTFEAFEPFINVFDAGVVGLDGPVHTITKQSRSLFSRYQQGERNLEIAPLREFNPFHDYIKGIYKPANVHHHIKYFETTYYTSGTKGLGLLYLDIDAHHEWQTDELRARDIVKDLFPDAFYRSSNRGQNGYLKVKYRSQACFNDLARAMQSSLRALFHHHHILCDFEVKGTITTREKSGLLAKLPFTVKEPECQRDDTDTWDYEQLERFKSCPIVDIRGVFEVIGEIDRTLNPDRIEEGKRIKSQAAADHERWERIGLDEPHPWLVGAKSKAVQKREMASQRAVKPKATVTAKKVSVHVADDSPESSDAFVRNHHDLRPFVREFYKQHGFFPEVDDALDWLYHTGKYSGLWEDNEARRAGRVGQILTFLERGFDPDKLRSKKLNLSMGRYEWWVRQHFGTALHAKRVNLNAFDPFEISVPTIHYAVPARFVETFLVVADACLKQDPLQNDAVPTKRFKKLWKLVVGGAKWNQKFYQLVRDKLEQMGVIEIVDRVHGPGKAWKWKAGDFPAESWKKSERQRKAKLKLGLEAVDLREFLDNKEEESKHNPLYVYTPLISANSDRFPDPRPPPDG